MVIHLIRTRQPTWCAAFVFFMLSLGSGCSQQHPPDPIPAPAPKPIRADSVTVPVSVNPVPSLKITPRFADVAQESGIDFLPEYDVLPDRYFLPEVMGCGAAWIDIDGDGWLDLFLANGSSLDPSADPQKTPCCRLWRNLQGERFKEVTDASHAGISLYGQGCVVGDYDADGFADLYIGGYGGDRLLHNQGDGTFVDVTDVAGVSDPGWTSSSLWIDLDGDHDLDLYAVHYLNVTLANHKVCDYRGRPGYCGPGHYDGVQDRVYLSQNDGTFVESAERLGVRTPNGKGLAIAAADFDDDLIPEIYVANDMTANFLFKRRPAHGPNEPLYTEEAVASGCAVSGSGLNEASMGIALADFDGDGRCDIYLTHYYHTKNTLYKNLGGLIFDDISNWSRVAAISHESLGFGTVPLDYDRDGAPDLFVANGHVLGPHQQPNTMTPQLLRNTGGMFADVSAAAGPYFKRMLLGRCAAAADYDNDGDLDVGVTHLNTPFSLLRNETEVASRPYLGLQLIAGDRSPPLGGRVVVRTNRMSHLIPITGGGSYLAGSDARLLFGWPEDESLELIEIHWPSGRVDRHSDLKSRHYWIVFEGERAPVMTSRPGATSSE
jgi:hypothetical protein